MNWFTLQNHGVPKELVVRVHQAVKTDVNNKNMWLHSCCNITVISHHCCCSQRLRTVTVSIHPRNGPRNDRSWKADTLDVALWWQCDDCFGKPNRLQDHVQVYSRRLTAFRYFQNIKNMEYLTKHKNCRNSITVGSVDLQIMDVFQHQGSLLSTRRFAS